MITQRDSIECTMSGTCLEQHLYGGLFFFSIFFVLSRTTFAGEATGSGSSKHLSPVSNARSHTIYPFFMWSGAPAAA